MVFLRRTSGWRLYVLWTQPPVGDAKRDVCSRPCFLCCHVPCPIQTLFCGNKWPSSASLRIKLFFLEGETAPGCYSNVSSEASSPHLLIQTFLSSTSSLGNVFPAFDDSSSLYFAAQMAPALATGQLRHGSLLLLSEHFRSFGPHRVSRAPLVFSLPRP